MTEWFGDWALRSIHFFNFVNGSTETDSEQNLERFW